jgi:hypothetical protein
LLLSITITTITNIILIIILYGTNRYNPLRTY